MYIPVTELNELWSVKKFRVIASVVFPTLTTLTLAVPSCSVTVTADGMIVTTVPSVGTEWILYTKRHIIILLPYY